MKKEIQAEEERISSRKEEVRSWINGKVVTEPIGSQFYSPQNFQSIGGGYILFSCLFSHNFSNSVSDSNRVFLFVGYLVPISALTLYLTHLHEVALLTRFALLTTFPLCSSKHITDNVFLIKSKYKGLTENTKPLNKKENNDILRIIKFLFSKKTLIFIYHKDIIKYPKLDNTTISQLSKIRLRQVNDLTT